MLNGSWSWSDNGISGWTNGTGENKRSSLGASTAINNNLAIGATAKRALLRVCAMDRDSSRANRGKKLARMRFLTRRTLRTPRVRTIVESVRNGTTFTFTSRPLIYFLRGIAPGIEQPFLPTDRETDSIRKAFRIRVGEICSARDLVSRFESNIGGNIFERLNFLEKKIALKNIFWSRGGIFLNISFEII